MSQRETRSVTAELRVTASDDGRTIEGLIPYSSPSVDLYGFTEIIAPGAFVQALEANADILALRDHDSTLLLGRTKSKTLTLEDSQDGLRYKIKLPNTTAANDLAESIDRGDLDGTSFGFVCRDCNWSATEDGETIRTLTEIELLEVSPCSWPAYPDSSVDLRSIPDEFRSRIEQRQSGQKGEPTPAPETPVADEDLENLKLRVAIRSRK
jgi:HK97 family phage prohead protease